MIGLQSGFFAESPQVTKRCRWVGAEAMQVGQRSGCREISEILLASPAASKAGDSVNMEFAGGRAQE